MNKKEIEQQIKDFADAMYRMGKDDGYKKGIEDTKAQLQRAYDNGYADGNNTNLIDEAYQEGLNDAGECAKKLTLMSSDGGFNNEIIKEIFGTASYYSIFNNMPISAVVTKIEDYEEEQKQKENEIHVGDEVYIIGKNNKSVVTHIFNASQGPVAMLLSGDAKLIDVELQYLNKTGKHYDAIEEVLKGLRGDEE